VVVVVVVGMEEGVGRDRGGLVVSFRGCSGGRLKRREGEEGQYSKP